MYYFQIHSYRCNFEAQVLTTKVSQCISRVGVMTDDTIYAHFIFSQCVV